jgi:hypothetical protein
MAVEDAAVLPGKETVAPGEPEYAPVAALPALPGRRLASIDALRGFDMFWLMQEEAGLVLALARAALPVYRRAKSAIRHPEPPAPR